MNEKKRTATNYSRTTRRRGRKGNTLALMVAITVVLLMAVLLFMLNYINVFSGHGKNVTALESTALFVAQDLSRVVLENKHFGFISLSDHPPVGKATVAKDNEPLPVFGINTLIGTARVDWIIAHEINNPVMIKLAAEDVKQVRAAATQLEDHLEGALKGASADVRDMDGNLMDVYGRAKDHYLTALSAQAHGGKPIIGSFKMSLGWLANGGTTVTDVPKPDKMAQVPPEAQHQGKYKSFINVPAYGEDFYFCGVSREASLAKPTEFRDLDGQRVSSVVKIESSYRIQFYGGDDLAQNANRTIHSVACAQPPASPDLYPPGQFNLAFPAGRVPRITTIRHILEDQELNSKLMPVFIPTGGDWPGSGSTLAGPVPIITGGTPTVSQAFAMGAYDWIRTGRTRVRIDEVLKVLDVDLTTVPGATGWSPTFITYTFDGCPGDANDPRLKAMAQNTQDAQNGYLLMTTLGDINDAIPSNSTALAGNQTTVQSTDGNQFGSKQLKDFWDFLAQSNKVARESLSAANQVLADPQISSNPQWVTNANQVKRNAEWTVYMSEWLALNLKDVTLLGIKQTSNTTAEGGIRNEFELGKDIYVDPATGSFSTSGPTVQKLIYNKQFPATVAGIKSSGGPSGAGQKIAGESSGDIQGVSWVHTQGTPSNFYFFQEDKGQALPAMTTASASVFSASLGGSTSFTAVTPPPAVTTPGAGKSFRLNFKPDGTISLTYALTPFSNVPASENQLYGVALDAMTTGTDLPVTWTAVMRDQSRIMGRSLGGRHAGQPSTGSPLDYINLTLFGGAPGSSPLNYVGGLLELAGIPLNPQPRKNYMSGGMAVEFQIRTPLILKCNEQVETASDQSGSQVVPLNPTIPPWLL